MISGTVLWNSSQGRLGSGRMPDADVRRVGLPIVSATYVSYDGALDPLGMSQVVPYLLGLSRTGVRLELISFEKAERWSDREGRIALRSQLAAAGIAWRPLLYHSRPRLPATAWDIARGAVALSRAVARSGATVVHCRGDVAMTMARLARLPRFARILYDIRGFFADERVAGGSWAAGSGIDRMVRRVERENLSRADAVVVLTRRALAVLAQRRSPLPPHAVVPTCVDLEAFTPPLAGSTAEFALAYVGSLGARYMAAPMAALAFEAVRRWGGRALFLTPDLAEANRAGITGPWAEVRTVRPKEVPQWLRRSRATCFLIRPGPAACPTKFAESLACGLPVVANRGIGDVDAVIQQEGVGALVETWDCAGLATAIDQLGALLGDPETPRRCRRLAERRYALDAGVDAYRRLYASVA